MGAPRQYGNRSRGQRGIHLKLSFVPVRAAPDAIRHCFRLTIPIHHPPVPFLSPPEGLLHVVTFPELAAIFSLIASFIYLLGFFGIDFVQSFVSRSLDDDEEFVRQEVSTACARLCDNVCPKEDDNGQGKLRQDVIDPLTSEEDEAIVESVVNGTVPSYSLEMRLGNCGRAAMIRRAAVERMAGRSLTGLPLDGFDYSSILGQCCEMLVGYVQLPVRIAGPMLLDGKEYWVPMATTEGCLVASTNRGCKAIGACGGARTAVLRDGMTRAPVVRFGSAMRSAELKRYLEVLCHV